MAILFDILQTLINEWIIRFDHQVFNQESSMDFFDKNAFLNFLCKLVKSTKGLCRIKIPPSFSIRILGDILMNILSFLIIDVEMILL